MFEWEGDTGKGEIRLEHANFLFLMVVLRDLLRTKDTMGEILNLL